MEKTMSKSELSYAKNLGKQVAKGGALYCPLCKGELAISYNKNDQDLSSYGDNEDILFCPHCETDISLVVSIPDCQISYAEICFEE